MTSINQVLSDGRELHPEEQEIVKKAEDVGICEVNTESYVLCANPDDPDYRYLPDRDCSGRVFLDSMPNVCPDCGRKVTEIQTKSKRYAKFISIKKNKVRDFIRDAIKTEYTGSVTTVSRKYCGEENEYVLNIDNLNTNIFLIFRNRGEEYLQWCKIYDENPVLFLIDEATPLEEKANSLQLPCFTLKDVFPKFTGKARTAIEDGKTTELANRTIKGKIASDLTADESILKAMKYDDFEQAVQCLLRGSIGNSQLLGSTESGSGVPDGTLSLHGGSGSYLYMWDAKFVKYTKNKENKTDLSGEYDKIFRHLNDLEGRPQVKNRFGDVQGIILFSPGINESNVVRLAEFIEERKLLDNTQWSGTVCYFTLEALRSLFDLYLNNKSDIQKKEKTFRTALHAYLSSASKHEKREPEAIRETSYDCVHMSEHDISNVFAKLDNIDPEEKEFNIDGHMDYLDLITF